MESSPNHSQGVSSPDYYRISLAAAMIIGLKQGRFYKQAQLHCVNLLQTYPEGCAARCSYCGLSAERPGDYAEKSFIRVQWPTYHIDKIITAIQEHQQRVTRICLAMVTRPRAVNDLKTTLQRLQGRISSYISLLVAPTVLTRDDIADFKLLGADRIGIAVDGATPEIFERHRGRSVRGPHRWDRYWKLIQESIEIFGPDHVGVHLIVGLGETEKEMVHAMQRVRDLGASTHLFSFYPECGSQLVNHPQPPAATYRRMQLARYLIDNDLARMDQFSFDEAQRLRAFGLPPSQLTEIIAGGEPFWTSGCPDDERPVSCTRPFGDSPPGDDVRSFPYPPDNEELRRIRAQLTHYDEIAPSPVN
jgi:biotin synthase